MTRGLFRAGRGVARRWRTLLARLRYGPFLSVGPGVLIDRGVTLNPFRVDGETLHVELAGGNRIGAFTRIQGTGRLRFGERSYCSAFCVFGVNERVEIGRDVMIADAVSIRDTDHGTADPERPMIDQPLVTRPVRIEDDVWIGHGATVLKGVTIGRRSIVAAGAVVVDDVEPGSVVGGVPARRIAERPS